MVNLNSNKLVILSGATGFIGSSLLKKLEKHYENILLVGQENKTINNKFLQCTPENLKIHLMGTEKEIYFYHLATHYSKDIKEKNKIFQANVTFGRKIVTELKKYNLVKIIYTNTMFTFYPQTKDYFYTVTKNQFSEIINNEFDLKNIISEIYLDNTFGIGDNRDKILNLIAKAAMKNDKSPILQKDTYLNLCFVEDVTNCLIKELKKVNTVSRITSSFDYNLDSIYKFLSNFHQEGIASHEIILKKKSSLASNEKIPSLNQDFKETNFNENLLKFYGAFNSPAPS